MSNERKLQCLEGIGYVAAVMIAVGSIQTKGEALKYFNVLGLAFAIIVIVRLMVMNISLAQIRQLYDRPPSEDSDLSDDEYEEP